MASWWTLLVSAGGAFTYGPVSPQVSSRGWWIPRVFVAVMCRQQHGGSATWRFERPSYGGVLFYLNYLLIAAPPRASYRRSRDRSRMRSAGDAALYGARREDRQDASADQL